MSERRTWKYEPSFFLRPLPDGPWLTEPDKVHWVDPATDLDCLIARGHIGALCGYVGLTPGHPLYGLDYDDEAVIAADLSIHGGGLTFAGACSEDSRGEGYGICHVPLPGRPADVWWLGFDCGHWNDLIPAMLADSILFPPGQIIYRDIGYVTECVTELARDLAKLEESR